MVEPQRFGSTTTLGRFCHGSTCYSSTVQQNTGVRTGARMARWDMHCRGVGGRTACDTRPDAQPNNPNKNISQWIVLVVRFPVFLRTLFFFPVRWCDMTCDGRLERWGLVQADSLSTAFPAFFAGQPQNERGSGHSHWIVSPYRSVVFGSKYQKLIRGMHHSGPSIQRCGSAISACNSLITWVTLFLHILTQVS